MTAPILTQASADPPTTPPTLLGVYRWRRTIAIALAAILALPFLIELWHWAT